MLLAAFSVGMALMGGVLGTILNLQVKSELWRLRDLPGAWWYCPVCGMNARWHERVPVLARLLSGRRMRCCGAELPVRWAVIEAVLAAAGVLLLVAPPFPPTVFDANEPVVFGVIAAVFRLLFVWILLLITVNNAREDMWVPDFATRWGILLGFLGALCTPGLAGRFEVAWLPAFVDSLAFSIAGVIAGLGLGQIARLAGNLAFKREGMSPPMIWVYGVIGAFLGWKGMVLAFFIAPFVGLAQELLRLILKATWKPFAEASRREVPYAASLGIATVIVLYLREAMWGVLSGKSGTWSPVQRAATTFIFWSGMVVATAHFAWGEFGARGEEPGGREDDESSGSLGSEEHEGLSDPWDDEPPPPSQY